VPCISCGCVARCHPHVLLRTLRVDSALLRGEGGRVTIVVTDVPGRSAPGGRSNILRLIERLMEKNVYNIDMILFNIEYNDKQLTIK